MRNSPRRMRHRVKGRKYHRMRRADANFLPANEKKCDQMMVNAAALIPDCRSPLITRAFHVPVAAPAGIRKEQESLPAVSTETLVAVMTDVPLTS